jgi:hypothetical protein
MSSITLAIRNVGKSIMFKSSKGMNSPGPIWKGVKGIFHNYLEAVKIPTLKPILGTKV